MTFNPKNYNLKNFLIKKAESFEINLSEKVKQGIHRLNKITDDLDSVKPNKTFDFELLLKRFWNNCNSLEDLKRQFTSKKDLKYILMGLNIPYKGKTILNNYDKFDELIELYPFQESELILKRISYTYLNFWNQINKNNNTKIAFHNYFSSAFAVNKFAMKKTKMLFKSSKYLINSNGVEKFISDKLKKEFKIEDALKEAGFPTGMSEFKTELGYQYLLKCFTNGNFEKFLISYKDILNGNGDSKKIIPLLVLLVDEFKDKSLQILAKDEAFKFIGDPNNKLNWVSPNHFTPKEKERLEQARLKINLWILESFIEVFFEKLINDPARKDYWLKKVNIIHSVKVYGPLTFKNLLKNDERIGNYVKDRYQVIQGNEIGCGIVMYVNNYELVEFTDVGSLYCYKSSKKRIPKNVFSIKDLKLPNMQLANNASRNKNEEGRIPHTGYWQGRYDDWINEYVLK
jgi:hypothetical protein